MRPPVGIGLRHPHYAEVLETRPALDFLEVHSENFFGDGGAALAVLAEARGHYAISLHGVGLALGSAAGIDAQHLAQLARLVERIEVSADGGQKRNWPLASASGRSAAGSSLAPITSVSCSTASSAQVALAEVSVQAPSTPATDAIVAAGTSKRIGRSCPAIGISGISMSHASARTATAVPI